MDDNSETRARARAGVRVRVGLCLEVLQDIVEQEEGGTGEERRVGVHRNVHISHSRSLALFTYPLQDHSSSAVTVAVAGAGASSN